MDNRAWPGCEHTTAEAAHVYGMRANHCDTDEHLIMLYLLHTQHYA